ncbi:MAG: hypothetical protein WA902_11025 [Thermosynechococcaceae cyanobacterium]
MNLSINCGSKAPIWESSTPFFLTRYPLIRNGKPRLIPGTSYQKDGPEHQALKALCYLPQLDLNPKDCQFQADQQGLVMLADSKIIAIATAQLWSQSGRWQVERKHGRKTLESGFRVRFMFPTSLCGPIGLGYSAHFGLGCMRPLDNTRPRSNEAENLERISPFESHGLMVAGH